MSTTQDFHFRSAPPLSRRTLLGVCLAGVAGRLRGALPAVDRILRAHPDPGGSVQQQQYRAHAAIMFCGMTIFTKQDVGGGYAVVEEAVEDGAKTLSLQFAGGSWPEKAHGVNRLGFIQEVVVEKASGDPMNAAYFGFMTSSAEKNFEQAKKSFTQQSASAVPYTATQGWMNGDRFSCRLYRLFLPNRLTFSDCPSITAQVRSAVLGAGNAISERREIETGAAPHTFLNSIRHALLDDAVQGERELVYNGKQYTLRTAKQPDGTENVRLSGTLQETGSDHRTPFQIWSRKGSCLPYRIEYKAKPFLKLVFEHEPHPRGPVPTLFLAKENA